jgi:hypothetical protein
MTPDSWAKHVSHIARHIRRSNHFIFFFLKGVPSEANGTNWMRKVEVQDGDVVGVAMQQSDLPMVQFFHNGEPLHELAINRFRGTVYPAVCLPRSAVELQLKVTAVMLESKFKQLSPGPRFGPIIVARSIV